jgi:dCMP deaminase
MSKDSTHSYCPNGPQHKWVESSIPFTYYCDLCLAPMHKTPEQAVMPKWFPACRALGARWCVDGEPCKFQDGWCPQCGAPERRPWPETWMSVAFIMAERSYDPRLQVGAIIVSADNTQMLSVGYNGNYKGGPHQHESSEPGKSGFIHAEVNALVKCDFNFPKKKHMYVTHMPCKDCAKLIINAEIARVVWQIPYRLTEGVDLLKSVGVEVMSFEEAVNRALAVR